MTRAAAFAAFIAAPAHATIELVEHDGEPFASVILHNELTIGHAEEAFVTLGTPHGPVTIRHVVTRNSEPDPRDTIEAWELPPNVIAVPAFIAVDEKASGAIRLYLWEGM